MILLQLSTRRQNDLVTLKNWNVSCKLQQNQLHVIRLQSFACSSEYDKISSSTIFRVKYTFMLGLSYIYFILSYVYVIILYGKASFRQIRAIWLVLFQSGFCSMYPSREFLFWSKAGKFKICDQNSEKKMWILSFSIAKLPEKAKKIEILRRFQDGWRRRTFSERVQNYPEHLELLIQKLKRLSPKARRP